MKRMANLNKSLVGAIEDKYKMDDGDIDIQIFGLPQKHTDEPDEIVVPKLLCLHDTGITHAGDAETLAKLCKNVTDVDLDRNAITDWCQVFEILAQIPNCSFLNLRANPLGHFKDEEKENLPTFNNVVKLVLNHTPVTWVTICTVLKVFPSLQELFISLNKYGTVDVTTEQSFPSLRSLHFRSNDISDWREIAKLGRLFPNLTNLVLLDNPLDTFPCVEEMIETFQNVKSLNMSETFINSWTELEKFRRFPALCELRVQGIPLLKEYCEDVRRQLLLGYLPNVTRLNGGSVKAGEKEDAERALIRHYMEKPEAERPLRYAELEAKHGKLDRLVEVTLKASDYVTVEVQIEGQQSSLKPVKLHWTTMDLRKFLFKEYDLGGKKMRLFLRNPMTWLGEEEMTFPTRTMLRYRLEDGSIIIIHAVPR